jgi:uncharacterized protein
MPVSCPPEEVVVESVRFDAGPHRLEGELAYPGKGPPVGAVVLAGPHPLLGGSMHNNVVRALGDGLPFSGLATLRFNYRGVGGSTGPALDVTHNLVEFWEHSRLPGEETLGDDLWGALTFLRSVVGENLPVALAGYSFGCTLLSGVVGSNRQMPLILIAPTVGTHDLNRFAALPQPKLVIAPQHDFALDEQALSGWFDSLCQPSELLRPALDGHFFRGHESWLIEVIGDFLDRHWRSRA